MKMMMYEVTLICTDASNQNAIFLKSHSEMSSFKKMTKIVYKN